MWRTSFQFSYPEVSHQVRDWPRRSKRRQMQKISTAVASAAESSASARDRAIWMTSSRSIAHRVRSKAVLLRAMIVTPITTIASPAKCPAPANPHATTANPVRAQARKVRSFAAWSVIGDHGIVSPCAMHACGKPSCRGKWPEGCNPASSHWLTTYVSP